MIPARIQPRSGCGNHFVVESGKPLRVGKPNGWEPQMFRLQRADALPSTSRPILPSANGRSGKLLAFASGIIDAVNSNRGGIMIRRTALAAMLALSIATVAGAIDGPEIPTL